MFAVLIYFDFADGLLPDDRERERERERERDVYWEKKDGYF